MTERLPPKQVIVVRADLKMQRGKEVAQGSHASMAFLLRRLSTGGGTYKGQIISEILLKPVEVEWMENGRQTKVCVSVDSREELIDILQKAKMAGVEAHIITDAGLTQFHGVPTDTAVAIGPDWPEKIDPITKHLKLR